MKLFIDTVAKYKMAYSVIALLTVSALAYAAEPVSKEPISKEPIVVDGDSVEYFQAQRKAVGTGNVSIKYKDMTLTCDKITVYLDTREGIAEGNVKVIQKGAYFTGEKINYNFDTKKCAVINGYVATKPFFGRAEDIDKPAGIEKYNLDNGYITTCDLENPHYRIRARHVEIYPNDKLIVKHIFFFVGKVPVFYLPYCILPLRETKSYVTLTSGKTDDWGYYVLTAYRLYLNGNNKADLLLDYRGKKGFGEGANYYYANDQVGAGGIKYYYTHENVDYLKSFYDERPGDMRARWRWQWRHKWEMPEETGTTAVVEFNRLSDRTIIKDYFFTEYEELGDQPDSYASVITAKGPFSSELLVRERFCKFFTVVERLPEYNITVSQSPIFGNNIPLYYRGTASAAYLNKTSDNSNTPTIYGQKDMNTARIDNYNRLSYAVKVLRALNLTPYAGYRNTYYARNKWGGTNQIRTVFDAGLDASIKFYKIYSVESNVLGLDIHNLRHIITPTANYYLTHQPTIDSANLMQFDYIDALDKANGVGLGLENRIQTKRGSGKDMQSVDLATFLVTTDYQFRLKKSNLAYKDHTNKFSNVDLRLELIPYPWLYGVAKMSVSPKNCAVKTETIDISASGDRWSLGIGHSYQKTSEFTKYNQVTWDAKYKINDKWSIRAYDVYNLDKSFDGQEYTLYRDLHCWIAEFTFRAQKQPHEASFWIVFTMKAFPDYPIGYRRSYSQPQFGSSRSAIGRIDTFGEGESKLVPKDKFII